MQTKNQLNQGRKKRAALSFASFLSLYLHQRGLIKSPGRLPTLAELKSDYINYLMDITGDNVREVAAILELPEKSLNQYQLWL